MKDFKWWTAIRCPLHGNSHKQYLLVPNKAKRTWDCPACGREFDENVIPTHPPPSRAMWERKFKLMYPNFEGHDNMVDSIEFLLQLKKVAENT